MFTQLFFSSAYTNTNSRRHSGNPPRRQRMVFTDPFMAIDPLFGQTFQIVRFPEPQQESTTDLVVPKSSTQIVDDIFHSENINAEAKDLYERAVSYFRQKNYLSAYKLFKEAFEKQALSIFKANMSLCFMKVGATFEALGEIEEAIKLDEFNDKYLRLSGLLNFNVFQNTNDLDSIMNCVDSFSKAFEYNQSPENRNNYLVIRKIWTSLRLKSNEKERQELLKYLSTNKQIAEKERTNDEIELRKRSILYNMDKKEIENFLVDDYSRAQENDVPHFLTDAITMDIPLDPYVTPSGYSYNKDAILNHVKTSGYTDPISRKPFKSENDLVENKALKKVIFDYILKNPWTFNSDENYLNNDFPSEWKFAKFL